ncbi:MAG: 50S ribosomal protein L5 [Candidatus Dependentiae bacterium]
MAKARLEELYKEKIVSQLKEKFKLKNVMEVPKLEKIVVNIGAKDAVSDSKSLNLITDVLNLITGQKPVRTKAKKSIAGFKLREGMPIGVKVTLRGQNMYEFLDRLINMALPKVRDFQGVPRKMDRRGNYNLGIKDWAIFPEVHHDLTDKSHGLNITFVTSTVNDDFGFELLKSFNMPFSKS